jgi:hypothetical protein
MALGVARNLTREQLDELGALRSGSDQAHLATQHVEKLRQLIERNRPQPASDRGAAVLSLDPAGRGAAFEREPCDADVLHHRAELEQNKCLSATADPPLAVNHRPNRGEAHPECDREQQRREDEQGKKRDGAIGRAFERELPATAGGDQRDHHRWGHGERRSHCMRLRGGHDRPPGRTLRVWTGPNS